MKVLQENSKGLPVLESCDFCTLNILERDRRNVAGRECELGIIWDAYITCCNAIFESNRVPHFVFCFCRACTAQGDNICTLQSRPWSQHHSCTLLFGMLSCLCFVSVVTICKTASAACTCNHNYLLLEHLWCSRGGRSLLKQKHNSIKWHYMWCLVIETIWWLCRWNTEEWHLLMRISMLEQGDLVYFLQLLSGG